MMELSTKSSFALSYSRGVAQKRLLCVFAYLICSIGFSASAQLANFDEPPIVIKFASDKNYPPIQYVNDGKASGLLVDIIEVVDSKIARFDVVFEPSTWAQAKNKVRAGQAFGLVGSYFHGHDWPKIYPYSYPIMYETLVSVCHEDSNLPANAKWPQDYQGLKIGTVSGFDGWLSSGINYRERGIANFFQYPNAPLAISAVEKNIVDCTLFEENAYTAFKTKWEEQNDSLAELKIDITSYISRHSIHIAYSQKMLNSGEHPYAREFIKAFDKALFELLISGQLEPLFAKYDIDDPVFDL